MSTDTGVIHDIGYQRYDGPRLGRRHVLTALYVHSLRAAFGLGRSAKAKIFPWFVIAIVTVVAVVVAAIRAYTGVVALTYAQYADALSFLILFFVAIVAPEIVSRDLRAGVLPLYFSRPLRHTDYVVAKFGALVTSVWLLLGAPQLLMFLVGAFTTKTGMRGVWNELLDVLPGLGYAAVWAVVFAALGMLIASFTGKRAFAAGGIVAVFLVTTPVVAVLAVMPSTTANQLAGLASPVSLVQGFGAWAFRDWLVTAGDEGIGIGSWGPLYAVVALLLVAACVSLLLLRYRKVATS